MELLLLLINKLKSTVETAKTETIAKIDAVKIAVDGLAGVTGPVAGLKSAFDTWKADWTKARAERLDDKITSRASSSDMALVKTKLDNVDAKVATRAAASDLSALAGKVGAATDADTVASLYGKLAEIKKSSGEAKELLAASLAAYYSESNMYPIEEVENIKSIADMSRIVQLSDMTSSAGADTSLYTPEQHSKKKITLRNNMSKVNFQGGTRLHSHVLQGKVEIVADIANLRAENIKYGTNVGGIIGRYSGPRTTTEAVVYKQKVNVAQTLSNGNKSVEITASSPIVFLGLIWDEWAGNRWRIVSLLPQISLKVNNYQTSTAILKYDDAVDRIQFPINSRVKILESEHYGNLYIMFSNNYCSFTVESEYGTNTVSDKSEMVPVSNPTTGNGRTVPLFANIYY